MASRFTAPAAACLLALFFLSLTQTDAANIPSSSSSSSSSSNLKEGVCPGVSECIQSGQDVLVALDALQTRHVSRVPDISACQSFCNTTRHTYYRYTPRIAPKKSLCHCFDGCMALIGSKTSVGLVSACQAKTGVQLKAQQAEELAVSVTKKTGEEARPVVATSTSGEVNKVVVSQQVQQLEGRKMASGFVLEMPKETLRDQQRILLEREEEMER